MEDVVVPSPGESVSSGILSNWLKGDGTQVAVGDEIFEFESDKVTLAVPANKAGKLSHIAKAGDEVQVNQVVARIDTKATGKATAAPVEAPSPILADPSPAAIAEPSPQPPPVSEAVQALIDQHALDTASITGIPQIAPR